MDQLNLRQAEVFRVVMRCGSMTRAAEMLGVSQPAVSRLITSMAASVGFQLFRRQGGGVMPTEDAFLLLDEIERAFVGVEELRQRAAAIREKQAGSVRITAQSHYGNQLLPGIIADFCRAFPNIGVSLLSQPRLNIGDLVASGRTDLGITTLPIRAAEGVEIIKLIARAAVLVMPRDHPLASKPIVDAADLQGERFVSFESGSPFRYEVDGIFDKARIRRQLTIEATTHEAACGLVAAGVGISVVSPYAPALYVDPRVAVRPFSPSIDIEIGLIFAPDRLSTAAATARDSIVERFRHVSSSLPL